MQGRTYLITGSASGIGAATASLVEQAGGRVIGCDLHNADIETDLSTPAGRQTLIDRAAALGPIDAIIAVAGGAARGVIETNYFGAVATLAGLRPLIAQRPAPRAAAVTSIASWSPGDDTVIDACLAGNEALAVEAASKLPETMGVTRYGCAKRALNRWIRQVAPTAEWGGAGIPINAVGPGVVDTPSAAYIMNSPQTRRAMEAVCPQPLGFPGRPETIGSLLLWLTSPANDFVTGQVIFADGGADAAARGDSAW